MAETEKTILVVDDEEGIRSLLRTFLTRAGYNVLDAANGEEAVELYRQRSNDISCAIVDMSMPRMDGIETCRMLQQIDPQCHMFICSGMVDDREQTVSEIADDTPVTFISKPFQFRDLVATIRDRVG